MTSAEVVRVAEAAESTREGVRFCRCGSWVLAGQRVCGVCGERVRLPASPAAGQLIRACVTLRRD